MTTGSTGNGRIGKNRPQDRESANTPRAKTKHKNESVKKVKDKGPKIEKIGSKHSANVKKVEEPLVERLIASTSNHAPHPDLIQHKKNIIQFNPGSSGKKFSIGFSEIEIDTDEQHWNEVDLVVTQENKEPLDIFWNRVWTNFLITIESRQRVLRDLIHFAIELEKVRPHVPLQELEYWTNMIRDEARAIIEVIVSDERYWNQEVQPRTTLLGLLRRLEVGDFKIDPSQLKNLGDVMGAECENLEVLQQLLKNGNYLDLIELTKAYRIDGSDWMDLEDQWFKNYLTGFDNKIIANKAIELKNYLVFLAEGYQRGYCIEDSRFLDRLDHLLNELRPDTTMLKAIQVPLKFLNHVLLLRRATWQEKEAWCIALTKLYEYTLRIANIKL